MRLNLSDLFLLTIVFICRALAICSTVVLLRKQRAVSGVFSIWEYVSLKNAESCSRLYVHVLRASANCSITGGHSARVGMTYKCHPFKTSGIADFSTVLEVNKLR
jgi:hypothetical protein